MTTKIIFEKKYPDGVKRKLLDISLLKKISPKLINKLTYSDKEFENKIKKIFLSLNYKTFKKLEKKSYKCFKA